MRPRMHHYTWLSRIPGVGWMVSCSVCGRLTSPDAPLENEAAARALADRHEAEGR